MSGENKQFKLGSDYEDYESDNEKNNLAHKKHVNELKNSLINEEAIRESLRKDVNELHETFSRIQEKHRSDFIKNFHEFMETVKYDIKEKIQKMNKIQEEKAKDENILKVIAERNLFREEAIRLNLYNKTLLDQLEVAKRKLKEKEDDYGSVLKKWTQSEDYNRQLVQELNNSVKLNQTLHKKIESQVIFGSTTKDGFKPANNTFLTKTDFYKEKNEESKSMLSKNFSQNNLNFNKTQMKSTMGGGFVGSFYNEAADLVNETEGNNQEVESFESFKKKCFEIIDRLKGEIKAEKHKFHKAFLDVSHSALEQKQLEKIFIECIEIVQNDIKHRRELDLLGNKQTQSNKNKLQDKLNVDLISYEQFLTADKRKLIINFFLSNEIINLVHDALFVSKSTAAGSINSSKSDISNSKDKNGSILFQKSNFPRHNNSLMSVTQFKKPAPTGLSFNITGKIKTKTMAFFNA